MPGRGIELRRAALDALEASRGDARRYAQRFSSRACAETFLSHLVPLGGH